MKHVPGRKTDVRDCEWIAQLLECGLLKGSFGPPPEIRDLRDLTRLRKTLVEDRTAQINRVGKILELANVKLASVVSNIMGVTGRRILEAMIAGEEDPKVLANLARGSLRGKRRELAEVVPGLIRDHHRFVLRRHLDLLDELSRQIDKLDMRIVAVTDIPFGVALEAKGGPKKAIVAVQHALLVAIWHMFSTGSMHEDLGPDHFQRRDKERRQRHLLKQLEKMGVNVQVQDVAA